MTHESLLNELWQATLKQLGGAAAMEASAREARAFLRPRAVKSATDLLRLILAYCVGGMGLRSTSAWGASAGLADLSKVALLQRPRERFSFIELTEETGGERLDRTPVAKGDILIADRGFMHPDPLAHILEQGADIVVCTGWKGRAGSTGTASRSIFWLLSRLRETPEFSTGPSGSRAKKLRRWPFGLLHSASRRTRPKRREPKRARLQRRKAMPSPAAR
jgi:hypothetical protein